MSSHAVLPRILGALFYYSPERPEVSALFDCLPTLAEIYPWQERDAITRLCDEWSFPDEETLIWQFSVLFEGQGEMVAPPWGSVYLEKDNLLMGETTAQYREFLRNHGLAFAGEQNEPEDQFGLMLLAYSALVEQGNQGAASTLLERYLLPWGFRYLMLLQGNTLSPFYAHLADVATVFLADVQQQYALQPAETRLYFG